MQIWILSDTHFNHWNIIRYCNRPFSSVEQMNDTLIANWNSYIKDDDIVLFLGDFCFARSSEAFDTTQRLTLSLKGHKIIVKGNHDFKKFKYIDAGWDAEFYQELDFGRFNFRHRPEDLSAAAAQYGFVFYGHVHDKIIENAPLNTINVCVDVNNFIPLDITNYFTKEEIKQLNKLVGK